MSDLTYDELIEFEKPDIDAYLVERVGDQVFSESEIMDLKLISVGWGSSGYYSADVLARDGVKAWPAGTHMYINHQSMSERMERPERDIRNLAAVTISDPVYQENGEHGAGLYAQAEVFSSHAPFIRERAKHIGVSITADGIREQGEAEGRRGNIIKEIRRGYSVDFVTKAGAGGMIISESGDDGTIIETTRLHGGDPPMAETKQADQAELDRLMAENQDLKNSLNESKEQIVILRKSLVMAEARRVARQTLSDYQLPDSVNGLITESITANLPLLESGDLDGAKLVESIKAQAGKVKNDFKPQPQGIVGFGESATTTKSTADILNEAVAMMVKDGVSEENARRYYGVL